MKERKRDIWLRLNAAQLLQQCRQERYRANGPGGQRRNKVETAVRLHHLPSGVTVQAEESRFLEENLRRALRRLKERMAITLREEFDLRSPSLPSEFLAQRGPKGTLTVNSQNPSYSLILATVLDALASANGSYATAARALGLTTSQLLRFLRSNAETWRAVERMKTEGV